MIRVFIIAPTPTVRAGLRAMLSSETLQVVGDAGGLGLRPVAHVPADVLLATAETGLADGLRELAGSDLAVLLLGNDERAISVLRGMPLRGWGVVDSETGSTELQAAVTAVANGLTVLPPALAARLLEARPGVAETAAEALTVREREVLELLSQGLPNKQIAQRLQISEHTVKFHVSSIFTKLGASSRTDAVSRGARQGLIAF